MLQQRGTTTFNEIMEQPSIWREVIAQMDAIKADLTTWLKTEAFGQVVFVGCGSSHFLCESASRIFSQATGIPSRAFSASDVFFYKKPPYDARIKALVIAISRSGETSETIWAAEKLFALDPRLKILTLTCNGESPLAKLSQKVIAFPKAREEGPVMTKCFTGFLIALLSIVSWYGGNEQLATDLRKLPDLFDVKKYQNELQKLASQKFSYYAALGAGYNYGIAGNSNLLVREMAIAPCYFYNTMEFHHGAFCTVNNTYFIICFITEALKRAEVEALREFAVLKGQRLLICDEADDRTKMSVEHLIEMKSGLSEYARLPLIVPLVQLFAFYLAIAKGLNPDKPKYVNNVVTLKEKIE